MIGAVNRASPVPRMYTVQHVHQLDVQYETAQQKEVVKIFVSLHKLYA